MSISIFYNFLLLFFIIIADYYVIENRIDTISKELKDSLFKDNYRSQFNQDIIMYYKNFYNVTNGFFSR